MASLAGGDHLSVSADLTDPKAIALAVEGVLDQTGHIDILVNNAGVFIDHDLASVSYDTWQQAWQQSLGINVLGPANLAYCVGRQMMSRRSGCIVNVSSRAAARGQPDAPGYAASKAALNAMSSSLAQALGPYGVAVHTVAPGYVATGMSAEVLEGPSGDALRKQSPLGRVATASEVARTVLFLASKESQFLTGGVVDINGASYSRP